VGPRSTCDIEEEDVQLVGQENERTRENRICLRMSLESKRHRDAKILAPLAHPPLWFIAKRTCPAPLMAQNKS
jgi:hypothetical protein